MSKLVDVNNVQTYPNKLLESFENNIEEMYSEQTDTNVYEYTENLESAISGIVWLDENMNGYEIWDNETLYC